MQTAPVITTTSTDHCLDQPRVVRIVLQSLAGTLLAGTWQAGTQLAETWLGHDIIPCYSRCYCSQVSAYLLLQ